MFETSEKAALPKDVVFFSSFYTSLVEDRRNGKVIRFSHMNRTVQPKVSDQAHEPARPRCKIRLVRMQLARGRCRKKEEEAKVEVDSECGLSLPILIPTIHVEIHSTHAASDTKINPEKCIRNLPTGCGAVMS